MATPFAQTSVGRSDVKEKSNSEVGRVMRDKEDERVDGSRRTWLIATTVAGGIGGVATVVPFVSSFAPSEKAKAAGAPVEVDIQDLKPGDMMTVAWRGKPVWILNRTDEMLADVKKADNEVADPHSRRMLFRCRCRNTATTNSVHAPITRTCSSPSPCAPIWAARRRRASRKAPSPISLTTGPAAFCARATARPMTWPAASSRTNLRRRTWTSRLTCSRRRPSLVIGKDEKGEA